MTAKIQISEITKQMIGLLKEKKRIKTDDGLLKYLLNKNTNIPKSMFGAAKGLGKWTKADRMKFHEW